MKKMRVDQFLGDQRRLLEFADSGRLLETGGKRGHD